MLNKDIEQGEISNLAAQSVHCVLNPVFMVCVQALVREAVCLFVCFVLFIGVVERFVVDSADVESLGIITEEITMKSHLERDRAEGL